MFLWKESSPTEALSITGMSKLLSKNKRDDEAARFFLILFRDKELEWNDSDRLRRLWFVSEWARCFKLLTAVASSCIVGLLLSPSEDKGLGFSTRIPSMTFKISFGMTSRAESSDIPLSIALFDTFLIRRHACAATFENERGADETSDDVDVFEEPFAVDARFLRRLGRAANDVS